jgi:hypothetical protein
LKLRYLNPNTFVLLLLFASLASAQITSGIQASALAPNNSKATFVRSDSATKGNWQSAYGADGYALAGDQNLNSAYAAPVVSDQSFYLFASSTTDTRGLQKAGSSADRIAAVWYSSGSFVIDTNIADSATHQVALYLVLSTRTSPIPPLTRSLSTWWTGTANNAPKRLKY